jgi:aminoglycoside phosphotransferase (APT) family kinase protein
MHEDEVAVDAALASKLLGRDDVVPVPSTGTSNVIFRVGPDLVARFPRIGLAVAQVERDHEWLPRLAPHLPVAVPEPVAVGAPGHDYPFPWALHRWIDGTNPTAPSHQLALDLAAFVRSLHSMPVDAVRDSERGGPLALRDEATRARIADLGDRVDAAAVVDAWDEALAEPVWDGPPAVLHGDLCPGNVLVREGRLAAVIDWGSFGIGDPAGDLGVGWNLLDAPTRATFREAVGVDDATWGRGRGRALSVAVIQLPYYWDSNPGLAAQARRTIAEVLADRA